MRAKKRMNPAVTKTEAFKTEETLKCPIFLYIYGRKGTAAAATATALD